MFLWADVKVRPVEEIKTSILKSLADLLVEFKLKTHGGISDSEVKERSRDVLRLRRMLQCSKLYSGNLYRPKQLAARIAQVARLNRLPDHNSPEAMQILRQVAESYNIDFWTDCLAQLNRILICA